MKVTISDTVRHLTLNDGRTLELGGLFEITNNEVFPIELELPLQLSHSLDAVDVVISASPSECSHSILKNPTTKRLSSEIWIMPLSSGSFATNSKTIRIAANDVTHVWAYTTVGNLQPKEDRLSEQSVPTRCIAHCQRGAEGDWSDIGKWGSDCYSCGNKPNNMGDVCYSCMKSHRNWCRWQDWRDWKDYTTVTTGVESFFVLSPAEESDHFSNQLIMKFINQSVPGRLHQIFKENVTIKH